MDDYKPNYLCDLHCHTTNSDGNDSYEELINNAAALGMKIIAVTDHDVLPETYIEVSGSTTAVKEYASGKGLILLPGIEISCDTDVDDVHIVGLGCDFSIDEFKDFTDSMVESKTYSYRKLTEILCDNGINVTWDMVLENNGKRLKDHLVQRKHIFEAIARAGYADDWSSAKIMVRDNPAFNVKRNKIDPVDAIQLIHKAGGYAILAHPYLIDESVLIEGKPASREVYIERLINNGLDGIEAAYTYNKTTYKGKIEPEEIEKQVIEKYGNRLKMISGGSDYHNDRKKGTAPEKARQIGEKGIRPEDFYNNAFFSSLL